MNMKEQLAIQAMYDKPKPKADDAPKKRGRPPKVEVQKADAE